MYSILVKYSEIILKGQNRRTFEAQLIRNLRAAVGNDVGVTYGGATIYIDPRGRDPQRIAEQCRDVFGVSTIAVARVCDKALDDICATAADVMGESFARTFKVESRRADKNFPLTSPELSRTVGGYVLNKHAHLHVDVNNPGVILYVDVREQHCYIYAEKIGGRGGVPVGTGGRAMLLLSGGIDSPVAAYCMARRGMVMSAVHFYSYPYTDLRAKDKVMELARLLTRFCGAIHLHCVSMTDLQLALREHTDDTYHTILLRRSMMRVAQRIAYDHHCQALVTGESLGQVASQTIESLTCTDAVADMPVLRPLIGMNKEEIVVMSRDIGTYETSILPFEDCCSVFTPKHPVTKPKPSNVLREEAKLDLSIYEAAALGSAEYMLIERN